VESDSEAGVETQSEYSFPAPQEPEITPIPFHSLGKPRSFSSFQSLADIAGIVKQRVQWTPSPTHYVQSTTPSGGNQLQSSMNLEAKINEKKRSERRKHCALAVARWSQKNFATMQTASRDARQPKFNQLEIVTTFTYKPSLVKIDARNFELSW